MTTAEKPYVLLVDDNEATCTLITALLHREFLVHVATDGQDAIERLRIKQYSVLLLDLRMPQVDGFGVLDFVRENNPSLLKNTLVVTAALSNREMARAKTYGICGIVTKPFDVEALLEAVKRCATPEGTNPFGNMIYSSGPMFIILANLLRQRPW